jgi:hypothetical protein
MGMYDKDLPPAPDYAAANREGVEAQADVLPLQIGIDRAARMGNVYTDPRNGKTYDFTGMGDAQLNELDAETTERLMRSGADIQRDLTKSQYADLMDLLPKYNELNLDMQKKAMADSIDASGQMTRNQYEQDLEYRPRFGDLTRSEDLKTFLQNLDLGEQGTRRFADLQNELLPDTNEAGLEAQTAATRAGREALRTTDPARFALMEKLVAGATEDLDAGSGLSPEQMERMQQNLRGAQAARGNIHGAGAAFDEGRMASEMGQNLQQQRRAGALAILQGSDVAPRYNAASPVNPMMPNYQSTGAVSPQVPNFAATTTGGPNLNPVGINSSSGFSYVNKNAGQQGADFLQSQWQTKFKQASEEVNPWMAGLGMVGQAAGTAGSLMAL